MTRRNLLCLAPLALLGIAAFPTDSQAGAQWAPTASCYRSADGSGSCSGTFQGFRSHADPYARVEFDTYSQGSRIFTAYLNGQWYSCTPYNSPSVQAFWPTAATARGYFSVSWDTSYTCYYVVTVNSSGYLPY